MEGKVAENSKPLIALLVAALATGPEGPLRALGVAPIGAGPPTEGVAPRDDDRERAALGHGVGQGVQDDPVHPQLSDHAEFGHIDRPAPSVRPVSIEWERSKAPGSLSAWLQERQAF